MNAGMSIEKSCTALTRTDKLRIMPTLLKLNIVHYELITLWQSSYLYFLRKHKI